MGNCMSSNGAGEDAEQKKKSQMIDRTLEEDSKKLRRECKILLLGTQIQHTGHRIVAYAHPDGPLLTLSQAPARVESLPLSSK